MDEASVLKPPSVPRATFVLNVLGISMVVALGVLTYVRLTKTTSMDWTGRCEYALPYCLIAGLWIWIAIQCRTGRRWARIAGTISFALWFLPVIADTVGLVSTYLDGWQKSVALVAYFIWIVGLASVVTMWRKRSGAVFTPVDATDRS